MTTRRMKSVFAVLLLAAVVGIVPQALAQNVPTLQVVIAGSSAMWQTMALGAYNGGTSLVALGGVTCHWTSGSNVVNLVDSRTTVPNVDPGTMWVVWDNNTPGTCDGAGGNTLTNVWAYNKVDSVVGVRCWFATPQVHSQRHEREYQCGRRQPNHAYGTILGRGCGGQPSTGFNRTVTYGNDSCFRCRDRYSSGRRCFCDLPGKL